MRWTAIILNAALFLTLAFTFAKQGMPGHDEAFLVYLALATPLVSLVVICRMKWQVKENLISLYLQRKRLEEKRRIEDLQK
ncbi:hypothetical protein D3C81_1615200 [compost metagenome]